MTVGDIFWLFFMFTALQPMLRQRMLEAMRGADQRGADIANGPRTRVTFALWCRERGRPGEPRRRGRGVCGPCRRQLGVLIWMARRISSESVDVDVARHAETAGRRIVACRVDEAG